MFTILQDNERRFVVDRRSETSVRWSGNMRQAGHRPRLHHLFERSCDHHRQRVALVCGAETYTYGELDRRANQLARYLISQGVRPGDRVGILLPRSLQTYVSLLAVLKAGAAFVPMDVGFPAERISFIADDAELAALITCTQCANIVEGLSCFLILADTDKQKINDMRIGRITTDELSPSSDQLCYIIYTSGSTGNPKGVAIEHAAICNFVQVAAEVYDIRKTDRIYQGMTIAFDFSIEEIWPGWLRGATIVAGPTDERKMGSGLAGFLMENEVTVFCSVPTLLATLDQDIPTLRTLIVGGEACPRQLVDRWAGPDRRMLNTYGPTEATVTATWGELYPGKPVTIGRPMPTYTIYLLDEGGRPVADGEIGEICIAGIGLARGYVNQPEKTRQAFIPDTLNTPDNPSGRIYRTGDLGRVGKDGEIEYLGRIDTQVKIRGYRIELAEIESVILESEEIRKVAVAPYQVSEDNTELVAYCELHPDASQLDLQLLGRRLRDRLPPYMVPAFVEEMSAIPLLANGKIDRNALPAPSGLRLGVVGGDYEAPDTDIERRIVRELGLLLGMDTVSVTDDFFLDLGAHSLIVARLVSTLRQDPVMASLGLGNCYRYPTVRRLAEYIDAQKRPEREGEVQENYGDGDRERLLHSNFQVWRSGIMQLCCLLLLSAIYALPALALLDRLNMQLAGGHAAYGQIAVFSLSALTLTMLVLLVGPLLLRLLLFPLGIRPGSYPLWGWFFLRFWLLDKAMAMAPLPLMAGTGLLTLYYRLLGARIADDVILASPLLHLPELVTMGSGSVVNTATHIFCYRVVGGKMHIAPVIVGRNCVIGSNAVLMPGTVMEDGAWLGDQSLLAAGVRVQAGTCMSGSPAAVVKRPAAAVAADAVSPQPAGGFLRNTAFVCGVLVLALVPLFASLPGMIGLVAGYRIGGMAGMLLFALPAGLSFIICLLLVIIGLKKLVLPKTRPGRYPIDSFFYVRKWFVDRLLELSLGLCNSLYATLYLAPFLRAMGARIGRLAEISTISHITPDLLTIGDESFVADIAHVGPAILARGTMILAPVTVGSRSFIGNAAFVPGGTMVGKNSLIGVLSVPPGPEVDADTTWLGSPPLFFPEREQSRTFPEELTYRPTGSLYMRRLGYEFFRVGMPVILSFIAVSLLNCLASVCLARFGLSLTALLTAPAVFMAGLGLTLVIAVCKWLLIGRYRPQVRPMWSPFVWRSELVTALYENVVVPWLLARLTGTPFMAPVLRLFGVRIGRRCYFETTFLTEFDLVEVGDDCAIGQACSLQTHLFEDRVMKMSRLQIGNRCTIGPRAVILYDATLEDGVELEGLSLVMKGETLAGHTRWQGSPARRKELS